MIANDLCGIYPNLSMLYYTFLTVPVISRVIERPFNRMEHTRVYRRHMAGVNGLSGLYLLSTEDDVCFRDGLY